MNAYREPDDENSLRARVAKVEERIAAAESQWRATLWAGWRWLGWALLIAAACAAIGLPIAWYALRTTAYGTSAHANAEREALRWSRTYWPTSDGVRLYCEDSDATGHTGERPCQVRFPDGSAWVVYCDDDPPRFNDGCTSSYQTAHPANAGVPR